uniref:Putative ovule protein n=1 Tax=Solanum chacoense TaxID=4108 RepID=A0A0V0IMV7_SOLCH
MLSKFVVCISSPFFFILKHTKFFFEMVRIICHLQCLSFKLLESFATLCMPRNTSCHTTGSLLILFIVNNAYSYFPPYLRSLKQRDNPFLIYIALSLLCDKIIACLSNTLIH